MYQGEAIEGEWGGGVYEMDDPFLVLLHLFSSSICRYWNYLNE